jgi:hypothetical protein
MVRMTVRISTTEPQPLTIDPMGGTGTANGRLLYGPNQTEANSWAVEEQAASSQVTPEAPVELVEEFSMPSDGLSSLTYAFSPASGAESEWMFTGVETLLP